ncbi:hypothetical protein J7W19_26795 [Streptomyces mobaraensis NBRC 13819 = DSM 40847]|uniref:Secreted protein n=1 Tax=Streptomyces mobaraensis (strain ATCC 29032 / DSM 40847 / JCM 4168 / NBRC 13819 / NCIMB 11159 / IPCR 16-22) TaxID=1223523 RepID=M3B4G5_STRM1|nr:hypothetical protein [Streptomyces mobaraensis]EMF00893.1 hypothetical protein H340_09121 [Streptomyces mobaraensis NBRC 13819 = DSM 40847]QTT76500.1 hypothetical protein J7W19_26795 [Streptomyces mobaraensis NBRC 13819 = DSM 40847]
MSLVTTRAWSAAGAAALLLAASAALPGTAAGAARTPPAVVNCAGSISVNAHPLTGAVDGKSGSDFRCATPDQSFPAVLTISGSVTGSGDLFFTTRTTDSLKRTDTGQVVTYSIDRRFDRDNSGATGNATERGSGSQANDSGTGFFGTGTGLVTFVVNNNYLLDVHT